MMKFGLSEQCYADLCAVFRQCPKITRVLIFGSRALGTHRKGSDIDLVLFGDELSLADLSAIRVRLDALPYAYTYDLVVYDQLTNAEVKAHIDDVGLNFYQQIESPSKLRMNSKSWRTYKIGEIGKIVTGKTPSTQNENNFGNKYPFITPRDMLEQKQIHQTERYLSEEGKNAVKNCLLPVNSICVSCIGSNMGKVVMTTKDSITNQQLNSLIANDEFDPDFVYYALVNISDELRNVGHHSTAVPILNKTDFSNFEITAPDVVTQRHIADILSAMDDKIELNHQTNATLEAIAQAIFKEWFMDFNFPGATEETVESKLGMIPHGWQVGKFGDLVDVKGGTTPSTRDEKFWDGEYHWATPKDLSSLQSPILLATERRITEEGVKQISSGILPPGTLLLSSRAPIGYLAISDIPVSINQGFIAINAKEISNLFILYWLKINMETVISRANGSTFLEISKTNFREIELVIPDAQTAQKFDEIIAPIFEQIKVNEQESITLANMRDSFLPKLLNGEIEV